MEITALLAEDTALVDLSTQLNAGGRHVITGVSGSARTVYIATLRQKLTPRPMVVVSDNQFHAEQLAEDLASLVGSNHVAIFPAEETVSAEIASSSLDVRLERVQALELLRHDPQAIVVTNFAGVQRYLPPVAKFEAAQLTFYFEHQYDLMQVQRQLIMMGYRRENNVTQPGEFALRGSILDIYALNAEKPVRLDFFDTELDSLKTIDLETQRSLDALDAVKIEPATDLILSDADFTEIQTRFELALTQARDQLEGAEKRHLTEALQPLLHALAAHDWLPELRQYLHLVYPEAITLLDYLHDDGLVVFDDYPRQLENAASAKLDDQEWWDEKWQDHQILPVMDLGIDLADINRNLRKTSIILSPIQRGIGNLRQTSLTQLTARPAQQFFGQLALLKNELLRWQKQGYTILLTANTPERENRLVAMLDDAGIAINQVKPNALLAGRTQTTVLPLSAGFELPVQHLVVLTERELFQQVRKQVPKRRTLSNAERLKSYNELKPGDYVVHVNNGIGIYEGMQTIERRGIKQDYITIGYQDNAKIFIPVTQLDLVQKYVGAAEAKPKITKLGGAAWQKAKTKVAKKVADIADELIQLSAERDLQKGFAFPKDDATMTAFEDAFPYPETPDQLRSTKEIKVDMERERPMDRLLVGDVGFGKTEVAFRAAFKAAHAKKQVAILAPTTILAQQHYESMLARFDGFDINVAVISRFQTSAQLKETKLKLKHHEIDIVVGTHRLISKDIEFADLGLVVIDEEQRFGVKHKEKLKKSQPNVDILTLTATPIPRTLNMSMIGLRDLSVIETPPANRYPIQTYVMEQNNRILVSAIEREMARGGQVYYLHNRVEDIAQVTDMVGQLVPEARVTFIHGQMTEAQMEGILVDFINGEYDVLVTTTIIETGVDIPNANTLYVENADHMGLAQLYQLRGRVGRSHNIAYAYFTYPQTRMLNEESEKRLTAIRDFTELGSGFKIAMRDLSIRGAGDLLGSQQHGFINAVGYDLYTQMLKEAVATKRGEDVVDLGDAELDLQVEAYLPTQYVADGPQKIDLYQRIRKATEPEQFTEIAEDLFDRFGEMPEEATLLLLVSQLKAVADRLHVTSIKRDFLQKSKIVVVFDVKTSVTSERLVEVMDKLKFHGQLKERNALQLTFAIQPKWSDHDWLTYLLQVFMQLLD